MIAITPVIIVWLIFGTLITLVAIFVFLMVLAFVLGLIVGLPVFLYNKARLALISSAPNKIENQVYFLGTIHTIPINRMLKDPNLLDSLFTTVGTVIVEAPTSVSKKKLLLKTPLLVFGMYFFKVFQYSGSIIPSLLYKEHSGMTQNVKENLERLNVTYKITDSINNLDRDNTNIVKCVDFVIDDWVNKNSSFVILNVVFLVLLFIGYSASALKLSNNPFIAVIIGLVSLACVFSPIILFMYMIDSTLRQRNEVAVKCISDVFNQYKKPVLVLYGKSHINEMKSLLDKNSINSIILK